MEFVEEAHGHRLYLANAEDGYSEGRVLVFRRDAFGGACRLGGEVASAPDLDAARRVAMMLLSGTRTADLSAQERSAEDEGGLARGEPQARGRRNAWGVRFCRRGSAAPPPRRGAGVH